MADENIENAPIINNFADDMYCWILDPNSSPQTNRFLLSKFIQEQRITYAVNTGSANAIELVLKSPITSYVEGQTLTFRAPAANTGAVTINVDGVGVLDIVDRSGAPLASGDIPSGSLNIVQYDNANFQLLVSAGGGGGGGITIPSNIIFVSDQGNDGTAVINNPELPWLSIEEAIKQIPTLTDGYLVHVYPGLYDQSVDFDGSIDGVAKTINIHFENGVKILNTNGGSLFTLRIINATLINITGSADIEASVNNASHTIVRLDDLAICNFKRISGDAGVGAELEPTDESYVNIEEITLDLADSVKGVIVQGSGFYKIGQIKITNATGGEALNIIGTGFAQIEVGLINSNRDGVIFAQEAFLKVAKLTATEKGIDTTTGVTNAVIEIGIIETTNGRGIDGSFNDSHIQVRRVHTVNESCIYNTDMNRTYIRFDIIESDTDIALEALNCNRENHVVGIRAIGATYAVDLLAQTTASTGVTRIQIQEIIGGIHGVRIRQAAVGRIHFLVDLISCIIQSTGVGVTDFPLDINWIALSAGTGFLKMKDCELIANGATSSIRNDGGVNFDIDGYNVHSATALDATDLTVSTITELF
jgi:hypothetical protein